MGHCFAEIKAHQKTVEDIIADEEKLFSRALEKGTVWFEKVALKDSLQEVSGAAAFKLCDTYGFPLDLTQLLAEERGVTVDVAGYRAAMEEARQRSRDGNASTRTEEEEAVVRRLRDLTAEQTDWLAKTAAVPHTNDSAKYVWENLSPATVVAIYDGKNFLKEITAEAATENEGANAGAKVPFGVILDYTNFYAESGAEDSWATVGWLMGVA